MVDGIVWFSRILWACRISILSGVAGVLLFWFAIPAQNLLADLSYDGSTFGAIAFWFGVFLFTFFLWAFPIHYGARRTLDDDSWILSRALRDALPLEERQHLYGTMRRCYRNLIRQVPRFLGLVPFVALAIGIYLAARADDGAAALAEGRLTIAQAWRLGGADAVTAALFYVFVWQRQVWTAWLAVSVRWERALEVFAWASLAVTTGFFVLAYFAPIFTSVWFPRALLVPPLFGSLVLFLSWLQRSAHRTGVPWLAILAVAAALATAANVPFDDLRVLPRAGPDEGRLTMADAAAAWKAANPCVGGKACPRPLVIAIDGGASRSAFTAASFVGEILDRMPTEAGAASSPGRRIFAISGVSGGAYGAAVIQAALADAQEGPSASVAPCRSADRTWFGYAYRDANDKVFTWRECLQALTSGDYLSPTIVGLAFRDFIAPRLWIVGGPSIEDRAVLLEQSFERHYDATVAEHPSFMEGGSVCTETETKGLCRRIAHPKAFLGAHPAGGVWMPLLLLNSTSVQTGRRVVASDLASSSPPPHALYAQAFDLGEALSSPCPKSADRITLGTAYVSDVMADADADGTAVRTVTHGICSNAPALDGGDLRLSTAALTSARFPLISPAGAFRMKGTGYGDRVVDGGYFENSGLTTALDVVQGLKGEGLDPLLLSIANDPDAEKLDAGLPRRPATTPLVISSANDFFARLFGLVEAPLDALVATRDGHAAEAEGLAAQAFSSGFYRIRIDQKPNLLPDPKGEPYDRTACKAIWMAPGKSLVMTKVSMSWWLSASVQADLDAQRCSAENRKTLAALMSDLTSR